MCRNAINKVKLKKRKKKDEAEELRSQVNIDNDRTEEDFHRDQLEESLGPKKSKRILGPMDKFASVINPESCTGSGGRKLRDQNISDVLFKQRTEAVRDYVCRWVYEAGISFNTIELDNFKLMTEAIGQFGPRYLPPTRYEMTVPCLKKEVERTKILLQKHEEEWKVLGCSIMTDAWSDRKRRSIMNLCVNSHLGTVFLSSKDFSDTAHTSKIIFEYVDKCIEEVGSDNVVQIVTDNASNNMGAAKLLKENRPRIFWTSCAAHTINLMLEGIAKQSRFKKVIDQAKALTVFLYAHHKAKEDIKVALNNVPKNFEPIIQVIDERMKGRLDSPVHRMACLLNPYYHYNNPQLQHDQHICNVVVECIDILYCGEGDMQDKNFMEELPIYKRKESTFGKSFAVSICSSNNATFDPVNWWSNFGGQAPNLKRLAMRILSLTSSSSDCERNWSAFEGVHTKKKE